MATHALRPIRAYCLLSQLQTHCSQSRQLLLTHRFASTSQAPSGPKAAAATASEKASASPSSSPPPPAGRSRAPIPKLAPGGTNRAEGRKGPGLPPQPQQKVEQRQEQDGEFVPQPLDRPLGVYAPPRAGENTGVDSRTLRQRRDDLVDYEKHIERRRVMTAQISRPYYRDWKLMRAHEGKLWVAPERLLRADRALYFPNLHGATLDMPHDPQDTTAFLEDRVSVVSVFSGTWAMRQVGSFTGGNADLDALLEDGRAGLTPLQNVRINIEQNALKSWLIRLFMRGIRRQIPEPEHETYFMVTRGLTGALRESIGMLNASVGFVYLVDHECKIRWAGSANAEPQERASLVRGATRLVQEYRNVLGDKHWTENGFDPDMFARAG